MKTFLLCFIPLFVAMDPIGIAPIFLSMTREFPRRDRNRIMRHSILTAVFISLAFLLAGRWIFQILGIRLADFQIAGGILLLVIAILDLVHSAKEERQLDKSIGVVPIGIPLMIGPAALTTLMMLDSQHPFPSVVSALLLNICIMVVVLFYANLAERVVGINGMRAFSKIISLFLAAIAVMFIRVGIQSF